MSTATGLPQAVSSVSGAMKRVTHQGHRPVILGLGLLDGGHRPQAGLAAAPGRLLDVTAPIHRQFQQAQGVARGRRVEDDHFEGPLLAAHVQEIHKALEGGHLGRAQAAESFLHHLDNLR